MVRVLDMLCQPVLSPVNLFTANWYLEVLESNKTCNASSCDQCSYSWESHRTCPLHTQSVVLARFSAWRVLQDLQDVGIQQEYSQKEQCAHHQSAYSQLQRFHPKHKDLALHVSAFLCIQNQCS